MAIDSATALKAYGQAANVAGASGSSPAGEGGATNFSDMVASAVADTEMQLKTAEQAAMKGATGEAPIIDVVTAVSAAELTLETVVAVRDEVVRAYQEIMRMPI
ncbi:MAG: flagellar hook-basal body complex protein FliE [Caulobacterales bacterium]|nr:flagellar hook-basal body complex protein FliE [Caulobacterales bacterium]